LSVTRGFQDAEAFSVAWFRRENGDRYVRICFFVPCEELAIVHSIKMVAGQDEKPFIAAPTEMGKDLTNGIGGSLKPLRTLAGLFGREDLDKSGREAREPIGL